MKIVSDWTTGNEELILPDRRPSDLNTLQHQDTALYNHTITTLLIVSPTTYNKTSIQHHQIFYTITKFHYKRQESGLDQTSNILLQTQNL